MAEAEDVITDAARHTTVFMGNLWRRYRPAPPGPPTVRLSELAPRLDLLITAVFDHGFPLRVAQKPARPTLLERAFRRRRPPFRKQPVPATNGAAIWLPPDSGIEDRELARRCYRVMALQQAARAGRGSALRQPPASPLEFAVYRLLEAHAADADLVALLPGMAASINELRRLVLAARPPLSAFPRARRPLECFLRELLGADCMRPETPLGPSGDAPASRDRARALIRDRALLPQDLPEKALGVEPLLPDWWTGELYPPPAPGAGQELPLGGADDAGEEEERAVSSRLDRRPEVREAEEDEDDQEPGVWMIQGEESHPHAEDPMGMQRPADREDGSDADEFGDMVSELSQARLVATPGRPKEVLLSDDPPEGSARQEPGQAKATGAGIRYPEWDYRDQCYHEPGATVRLQPAGAGSREWVDATLEEHRAMLHLIRRRFEMLQARRVWQRRQLDGDEIDLDAYIDAVADYRAGGVMAERLYQRRRTTDRHMAITLLIDISGSTDSWIASHRRVIDVEREALLLVCNALEGMGEPYSVQAFSGEGPRGVTVQQVKDFDEHYSDEIALRISALQPQHYTRAGAAVRHASAGLMNQPGAHRLLLVLSDGKPNDSDHYEGRYGVEDMRQAVLEAHMQGIRPFCLTIDRQAANYLPRIFGAHQYALLPRPELLPMVLLDWMKRLVAA